MSLVLKVSFIKRVFAWRFFFGTMRLDLSRQIKSLLTLNWHIWKVCF